MLGHAGHVELAHAALFDQLGQVVALRLLRHAHQRIDVGPALRPHVAEQVRRDRPLRRHDVGPVVLGQLGAHVTVQRLVQRLQLADQPLQLGGERLRRHVVAEPPQRTGIGVAELAGALVGQLDHPRIAVLVRRRDVAPGRPDFQQLVRIATLAEDLVHRIEVEALLFAVALAAVLERRVLGRQRGDQLRELRVLGRVRRRGQAEALLDQRQLALCIEVELEAVEAGRLARPFQPLALQPFGVGGRQRLRIGRDVGRVDPLDPGVLDEERGELRLDRRDELARRRGARRRFGRGGIVVGRRGAGDEQCRQQGQGERLPCFHSYLRSWKVAQGSASRARSIAAPQQFVGASRQSRFLGCKSTRLCCIAAYKVLARGSYGR